MGGVAQASGQGPESRKAPSESSSDGEERRRCYRRGHIARYCKEAATKPKAGKLEKGPKKNGTQTARAATRKKGKDAKPWAKDQQATSEAEEETLEGSSDDSETAYIGTGVS